MGKGFLKKYWLILLVTTLLMGVWIFTLQYFMTLAESNREEYLWAQRDSFASDIESITGSYENFADYIFDQVLNQEPVLSLFAQAQQAAGQEQDELRQQLHTLLAEDYARMENHHFERLNFHFPNGENFLRMSHPMEYGDQVYGWRETVRQANEEMRYRHGFEIGRTMAGYRFVYPLFYEEDYIGSVELAVSLAAANGVLEEVNPNRAIFYVFSREAVEKRFVELAQTTHVPKAYLDRFLFAEELLVQIQQWEEQMENVTEERFRVRIWEEALVQMENGEGFSLPVPYEEMDYLMHFFPIEDVTGDRMGYFVSIAEDSQLAVLEEKYTSQIFFLTLTFLMGLFTFIHFDLERRRMKRLASTDYLTGLYNRYKFSQLASAELFRSVRYERPLSVIMFDIDHFKKINDRYGHLQGDRVLKEVAFLLRKNLRECDLYARWGGEEFIIMLPETGIDGAYPVAERLRKAFTLHTFAGAGRVTVSCGVVERKEGETDMNKIIDRADDALYQAKEMGRNQVVVAE